MTLTELVEQAEIDILKNIPPDLDEIREQIKKERVPAGLAESVRQMKVEYEIEPGSREDKGFDELIEILKGPEDPGLPGGRRRKTIRFTRVKKSRRSQRLLSLKQRKSYSGSSTSYLTKKRKQGSK
jgi:hypothetical protein